MPVKIAATQLSVVILSCVASRFLARLAAENIHVSGVVEVKFSSSLKHSVLSLVRRMARLLLTGKRSASVRQQAKSLGAEHYLFDGRNAVGLRQWLENIAPDVMLVYIAPILEQAICRIPHIATLNLHPSLLPKYRGGHPILWMARDNDLEGGVTLHLAEDKPDSGDIIQQARFVIPYGASEEEIEREAIDTFGVPLVLSTLRAMQAGEWQKTPQTAQSPTPYAKRLPPEEIWDMLDWQNWSIEHCWHYLRCCPFWISRLKQAGFYRPWCRYQIAAYETADSLPGKGELGSDVDGLYFAHRDGKIRIRTSNRVVNTVRKIVAFSAQG